jgi:hypothetical protein
MFCVKCGVELADSEKRCPLCNTPVYYPVERPEGESPYPEFVHNKERISPRGLYFVIAIMFLIASVIVLACDISVNGGMVWSGIALGGLLTLYVLVFLPMWFKYPYPAVFVPVDFATVLIYLLYIDLHFSEYSWFLGFALPLVSALALIVIPVAVLTHYLRCGYFYIYGGAFIGMALFSLLVEYLIHINFAILHTTLVWSIYPFIALLLIGIMLIVIAIVPQFRESIKKIFAI